MKLLRRIVDSVKPHFTKGGKFEKFHPAFDALETFLFVPGATTKEGVHVRDAVDLKRTMVTVIIALIPTVLFGMWNVGHQHHLAYGMDASLMENFVFGFRKVLPVIIVSYAVGLVVEFVFAIVKGHPISEGYLVTGLLIPLTLPVTIPLWMVVLGTAFGIVFAASINEPVTPSS
ncbi:MAG TPA: RnfABCDGE type electron transport complex subunit D, partial [Saprospiraceae bacterium]|nr:RnfABCDGE type electron transport complex subunit D [Saprospiraceae bacterium]